MMLVDEKGEQFTSENFSAKMASFQLNGTQRIVFVCGGAYGFNEKVY